VLQQQEVIVHLTEKIQELFHGSVLVEKQQEQMSMQQDIINKLLDKIN
jgi:hypothetical protein